MLKPDGYLKVSVDVANTGNREGKETVELYTHDVYASLSPPMKRLRAFKKIDLKPGESRMVDFELTPSDLAFVNAQSKLVTEPGVFEVMAGNLKADFKYEE